MFWREIARDPDAVFAVDRAENTAWNLWQAVERSGRESRASGWNRRFIEEQFGKPVADRLRGTMMAMWRKDRPTLRSERPDGEKDTFLVKMAIWPRWESPRKRKMRTGRSGLTEQEAELACRYAPMELNGFPSWLESLAVEHPAAVDRVLGEELSLSLREVTEANAYSMFLQNISHASAIIAALFVPRIRAWLSEVAPVDATPNNPQSGQNLRQAIEILVKSGNDNDRRFIEETARRRLADSLAVPFANVWLRALLHLNAVAGVEALENGLTGSTPSKTGAGVQLFAGSLTKTTAASALISVRPDLRRRSCFDFFGSPTSTSESRMMHTTKVPIHPTLGTTQRKAGVRSLPPCSRRQAPRVGPLSSKWSLILCLTTSRTE